MKRKLTSRQPTKRQKLKQQALEEDREHDRQCVLFRSEIDKIGTLVPGLPGIPWTWDLPGNAYQDLVNCFPISAKLMILYNTIKTKLLHLGGDSTCVHSQCPFVSMDTDNNQIYVQFTRLYLDDGRVRIFFHFKCKDILLRADYTKDKESESSFDEIVFKKKRYQSSHRIPSIVAFGARAKALLATLI